MAIDEKTLPTFTINYLSQTDFNNLTTKNADELYLTPDDSITEIIAGTGLSGGGANGSITLNHSNSVTAKTTQAVYPITFDAQGHITGAGNAITPITSHNTAYLYVGTSSGSMNAATTNGNTYFILVDGGSATSRRKISGAQNVSVTSDSSGNITITGPSLSNYALSSAIPTQISQLSNDAGYITSADVPEGASAYTGTISAVGTSASTGTNNGFARGDHVHNITKTTINSILGTGSGTTKFYREDGTWATPAYTTNTDTKLQVAEVTSATQYYPLVGTGTTAATRQYDTTGFKYKGTNGTTSTVGSAILELGNSTASGTAGNKRAQLIMYGTNAKKATITLAAPSADIALALPTSGGTLALTSQIPTVSYPVTSVNNKTGAVSLTASDVGALASTTTAASNTTGITASTTATKTTLGTAFTIPNVTSAGSASTWAFEDIACDDITGWSAGSGSASISGAVDSSDSTQLNITISHTHTAPTLQYTARTVSSKKSGANGSAPTLGTAFTVPNVTSNTSATVSITDNGHTHTLS